MRAVPLALREASLALGATRTLTIVRVVVPAAVRGIVTAAMLGLARVAGETAPLLFTALSNAFWSPGILQPTASLPVTIYNYAVSPYDDWHRQAPQRPSPRLTVHRCRKEPGVRSSVTAQVGSDTICRL